MEHNGRICFDEVQTLSPEEAFEAQVPVAELRGVRVRVEDARGKRILSWEPEPDAIKPIPDPAKAALDPRRSIRPNSST